jgi:glycine dehydrogenase subunit 1
MPFIPHTPDEIEAMLAAIGAKSLDDLFADIPQKLRIPGLRLDAPRSEFEVMDMMARLAARNKTTRDYDSYLGGGVGEHFIPAAVAAIASRGEFATAYTPYQAEASQGTLQAIYEFQSMICALTGLDAANASMYDGASALAEAALMAMRSRPGRTKIVVPASLGAHYRTVLRTYTEAIGAELVELPLDRETAASDLQALRSLNASEAAAIVVPVTNWFGQIEPWRAMASWAAGGKALTIAVANPMSLSALTAPGEWGADICVGEGQPMGLALEWGGPYAGFMSCRAEHIRKMPGRIVGCANDDRGQRGFVLTLQTREQHIRRDKATSNICTNQGLCALQMTIYMALIGQAGLERLGQLNMERAGFLRAELLQVEGVEPFGDDQFFNEFSIRVAMPAKDYLAAMRERGILAGLPAIGHEGLDDVVTVCATETKSRERLLGHVEAVRQVLAGRAVAAR